MFFQSWTIYKALYSHLSLWLSPSHPAALRPIAGSLQRISEDWALYAVEQLLMWSSVMCLQQQQQQQQQH